MNDKYDKYKEIARRMLNAARSVDAVSLDDLIEALGAITFSTFMMAKSTKSERLVAFDRWAALVRDIIGMEESP